ncbi:MAG: hypothetical protein B6226_00415 [Candidatus Cloacimonetes bacterium 4572_65]|nr:MAG: hypothetical protein B6226_00415 [Candidatus Cloacimonetes bacterium 4572_65]
MVKNIIFEYISVFVLSFLFVLGFTPWIIKLARKINFVDKPEARKTHVKVTPLMGGVSLFAGFSLLLSYDVLIAANRVFDIRLSGFLLGAFVIVLVGLIDDKRPMNPYVKLFGQFLACAIFIVSNFGTVALVASPLFGGMTLPHIALQPNILFNNVIGVPLMLFWMIGLMNALNFLDNMDGMISGMSAIIALGFFGFSLIVNPENSSSALWISLMGLISLSYSGAALGFLKYNFNPAKIFLGDAGSMFIGYFLATMGILMANFASIEFQSKWFYLLPVLLISFAVFDITFVSTTRYLDGRRLSQGGKDHTTHRIFNALSSVKVTALMVYFINIVVVIITFLVTYIGSVALLLIMLAIFIALYSILAVKLYAVEVDIPVNQLRKKKK